MKIKKINNTISIDTEMIEVNQNELIKVLNRELEGYSLAYQMGYYKGTEEQSQKITIDIIKEGYTTPRNLMNILDFIYKVNKQFSIRLNVNGSIYYPENTKEGITAIQKELKKC